MMDNRIVAARIPSFSEVNPPASARSVARKAAVGHKRNTAEEHSGRADVFAEERIRFIQQRQNDNEYNKEEILEVTQLLIAGESANLKLLGERNLVQQILNQSERTKKTANKPSAKCADEHKKADNVKRKIVKRFRDQIAVAVRPDAF